jgi:phosphoribosylaminoimidazole-succinocarboxamide synthase
VETPALETALPLPRRQGKVRDVFDLPPDPRTGAGRLLMVASDRISAFDVVMPTPIAGKGALLTRVSILWFDLIRARGLVPTHLITTDLGGLADEGVLTREQARGLEGRSMIVRRARVVPIECVARGYLDGSGWNEYREAGAVCGVTLPPGLKRGDRLPTPIFTPATKEAVGTHDINVDFATAAVATDAWLATSPGMVRGRPLAASGRALMERLRDLTLAIYAMAHEHARARGLILADTKFEFGFDEATGELMLVDEVLTPDSSRYWDAQKWTPGGEQASFDKQFLREYLNGLTAAGTWDKKPPGPALPPDVVRGTVARYEEVRRRLEDPGVK